MELRDLKRSLRQKYLALRNLNRLVDSEYFQRVYTSASKEARVQAALYIESGNKKKLLDWIVSCNIDLDLLPIRALRERAQKAGVKWYNRLTRDQLILEIIRAETSIDQQYQNSPSGDEISDSESRGEEIREPSNVCV